MIKLRFRTLDDAARAELVLDKAIPGYTALPGGVVALSETLLGQAEDALNQAGLEFRQDPIEEYLGGRHADEFREEGESLEPW